MLKLPEKIKKLYLDIAKQQNISEEDIFSNLKWLRFYLDFCHKYAYLKSSPDSLVLFMEKLKQKQQTEQQIKLAKRAINLFYKLIECHNKNGKQNPQFKQTEIKKQPQTTSREGEITKNQSWEKEYQTLKNEIKIRQLSPKTYKAYKGWVYRFQAFLKSKSPALLTSNDAKQYITNLAVVENVSASSQNQAFNALLFFYRYVIRKDFGQFDNIPRAKKIKYEPAVLSRREVDAILENLVYPVKLCGQVLYGCGLRLAEGVNLRIRDFDFDEGIITVFGKGRKFRKIFLPKRIIPDLQAHFKRVENLYIQDMKASFDGAFMPDQVENKYKNSAKDFGWQFAFPAKRLTRLTGTKIYRRYHIHESVIQKSIKSITE